jgi:hypothetical protein
MSDTEHSHLPLGDRALPDAEPTPEQMAAAEAEALEQMRRHMATVTAADMVIETAVPLLTLAFVRLGVPPERNGEFQDLAGARLLIDALGGMLEASRGRLGPAEGELMAGLSQARMAYVQVTEALAAEPAQPAAQPAPRAEEDSGLARPQSGLWVPGME